jgi:hypothetical protein
MISTEAPDPEVQLSPGTAETEKIGKDSEGVTAETDAKDKDVLTEEDDRETGKEMTFLRSDSIMDVCQRLSRDRFYETPFRPKSVWTTFYYKYVCKYILTTVKI